MATINPISKLYDDIVNILNSITIKYAGIANAQDTMDMRFAFEKYSRAYLELDKFTTYTDYTVDEYATALGYIIDDKLANEGVPGYVTRASMENSAEQYALNPDLLNNDQKNSLLVQRRQREIDSYDEQNDYYRELNGLPPLSDYENYEVDSYGRNTNFFYLSDEVYEEYNMDKTTPIHLIEKVYGTYYITLIENRGIINTLVENNPTKEYLKHLGSKSINIYYARKAKNFSILYIDKSTVRDSTMKQFLQLYEASRQYFVSTIYVYEYRNIIKYYDNFIGMCVFIMAVQQLSVRAISNAADREFYDEYCVQLLYSTYGIPYSNRIDQNTQQQIVQNLNLLIQNKATDKVLIDIASLLGFNNAQVYNYYLVKEREFDSQGRPVVKKRENFNNATGRYEEGYDYEEMYDLHFQRVNMQETNTHQAIMDPVNRVEYKDLIYYDPFWWEEDDELYKEVWDTQYNIIETKYLGMTLPYKLTELIFQSVILLQLIMDKYKEVWDLNLELPKITDNKVSLVDTIILLCALFSKKNHLTGEITQLPSKIINVLEVLDQDINHEEAYMEVLRFDFFDVDNETKESTLNILKRYLIKREYQDLYTVKEGRGEVPSDLDKLHDIDPNTEYNPNKLVKFTVNTDEWDQLCDYLSVLFINDSATNQEKVEAINKIYANIKGLYNMLSYIMGTTNNYKEYYAIKKFYDTLFYSNKTYEVFKVTDPATGSEIMPKTFLEYLKYKNSELYNFVESVDQDLIYEYIDHVIYKLEDIIDELGSLYIMNNSYSPLEDLLRELIIFFKSYTTDMVDFSSILVVDYRMENIIRLIDHPANIGKSIGLKDMVIGLSYSDFMKQFSVKFDIKDVIKLNDYLSTHTKINISLPNEITVKDLLKEIHSTLTVNTPVELEDDVGFNTVLNGFDKIGFTDKVSITYNEE